jgi:type VI secretion system secreted protein VgrG
MSRLLEINTPIGKDDVLLRHLSGQESLGRLPEYHLSLVAKRGDVKASELLGKNITIGIELPGGNEYRYLNGYITQFADAGHSTESFFVESGKGKAYLYEATLQTSLWFLTRAANCRMLQDKTVPEIIVEVLSTYPFAHFDKGNLTATYPKWEYCCQYRETDFNFISRLMEQEGIYYYFKHEDGKHTMMLCDSPSAHSPKDNYEEISFVEAGTVGTADKEHITDWHINHQIQPGRYALNDFNFKKPRADLSVKAAKAENHELSNFEYFDYPGEYEESGQGKHYVDVRLEELHSQYEVSSGGGSVRGIQPGHTFNLVDYPRDAINKEYLVIGASYSITNNSMGSGGGEADYHCSFHAITSKTQFRTQRNTPKPIVQGPQTALVVGPSGEEIFTDEYGRVKVQFHWDRYNDADEKSSCWIRVSTPWAGKTWGMITIPRVGHEVVVSFLEGDPDWPIITGSVYNGEALPPWELPANKTQSGIKTRTYKGDSSNFNEFRFEDKKGEEQIFLQAEKDKEIRIKHDRVEWIGNESHLTVEKDVFEKMKADHHLEVTGDDNAKIDGSVSLKIGQNWLAKVGTKLAADVGTEIHFKSGANAIIEAGADIAINGGGNVVTKAGSDITLKGGGNIIIEAGTALTLKVGGSFVVIDASGVSIKGPMVNINSGGSPGSAGSPAVGTGASPEKPKAPRESIKSKGGEATTPQKPKSDKISPQAASLKLAAQEGVPFCEICQVG